MKPFVTEMRTPFKKVKIVHSLSPYKNLYRQLREPGAPVLGKQDSYNRVVVTSEDALHNKEGNSFVLDFKKPKL